MTTPTPAATSRAEATLILRMELTNVKGAGYVCEAGGDEHNAEAIWVIKALRDSEATVRFLCDKHRAELEASPTSTKGDGGELAAAIRYALDAGAYDKKTGLRMIQQAWLDQKFAPILARLDSSPPADYTDIVGLREKLEARKAECERIAQRHSAGDMSLSYDGEARGMDFILKLLPPNPKAATSGEGQ